MFELVSFLRFKRYLQLQLIYNTLSLKLLSNLSFITSKRYFCRYISVPKEYLWYKNLAVSCFASIKNSVGPINASSLWNTNIIFPPTPNSLFSHKTSIVLVFSRFFRSSLLSVCNSFLKYSSFIYLYQRQCQYLYRRKNATNNKTQFYLKTNL